MKRDEWPNMFEERIVLKYIVPVDDKPTEILMPWPSRIIHVGHQVPDHVTFWAESLRHAPAVMTRAFVVHGTGHVVDSGSVWRGTMLAGPFVWHLYELRVAEIDADGT